MEGELAVAGEVAILTGHGGPVLRERQPDLLRGAVVAILTGHGGPVLLGELV